MTHSLGPYVFVQSSSAPDDSSSVTASCLLLVCASTIEPCIELVALLVLTRCMSLTEIEIVLAVELRSVLSRPAISYEPSPCTLTGGVPRALPSAPSVSDEAASECGEVGSDPVLDPSAECSARDARPVPVVGEPCDENSIVETGDMRFVIGPSPLGGRALSVTTTGVDPAPTSAVAFAPDALAPDTLTPASGTWFAGFAGGCAVAESELIMKSAPSPGSPTVHGWLSAWFMVMRLVGSGFIRPRIILFAPDDMCSKPFPSNLTIGTPEVRSNSGKRATSMTSSTQPRLQQSTSMP
mmetsp:Transcript_25593/g.52967  ORF Transcript_25593/g.52967 Transcript_25593/m.52967 type:complete len:296 (-) Transcript_25593:985-1872(-)